MGWDFIIALIKLIVMLPLVIILAYLVIRYALPRLSGTGPMKGSHLQIVDRLVLSTKSSIIVLKAADSYYLLANNDGATSLIKELDDYPEIALEEDIYPGLSEMLQKTKERIGGRSGGKGA